jgi:thiosulfate dehydrogenase [quinone] large subunit
MLSRDARYGLAAIQLLVGAEWLVSGTNKLLSGTFPQGLADALQEGIKDNPNVWYVDLLDRIVLPHSVVFGYLVEYGELAVGVILLSTAVLLFGPPRGVGEPRHKLAVAQMLAAAAAAAIGAFFCVNFHFWMGDGILPSLGGARAFDEAIDLDMLMPPLSLLIVVAHLRLADELTGHVVSSRLAARARAFGIGRRGSAAQSQSAS